MSVLFNTQQMSGFFLSCHNMMGYVNRMWAMLVKRGAAAFVVMLAWVTVHVDMHMY